MTHAHVLSSHAFLYSNSLACRRLLRPTPSSRRVLQAPAPANRVPAEWLAETRTYSKLRDVSEIPLVSDQDLYQLAEEVGRCARAAGWRIVTAESCTAGWIAKALTDVPGSSGWVDSGYVTYSNTAKVRDVGVSIRTLDEHGAVSEATVREMANGALRAAEVEMAIAVSGIAGPDGGTAEKPVGTVWFAVATVEAQGPVTVSEGCRFGGDRDQVRRQSVDYALRLALRLLRAGSGR